MEGLLRRGTRLPRDLDDDARHVVAADAPRLPRVRRDAPVEHGLADLRELRFSPIRTFGLNSSTNKVHGLLVAQHVPDAITGHDEELVLRVQRVFEDVGFRGNNLFLGFEVRRLLVLEVADGP